jgi:PST family polysaccharide transporter
VKAELGGAQYLRTDDLKYELARRTAKGGAVTVGSQALKFLLSIVATMVLARLLTPDDYGLIGMVAVVTGFIAIFKDLGLGSATIQKEEVNADQISTLFWVNVLISFGLMLVTAATAPLVSWFYGRSQLALITLAYATGFLFGGLAVQHEALLRRRMRFGTLAISEVMSFGCGLLTSILLAWFGFRYWALVSGQLAQGFAYSAMLWIGCSWRPGLPVRGSGVRSMLRFGRNLTGFSVINYFARNLDNMLIGRFWGSVQLGFYAKAYQLLLLPMDQINTPITAVAVPALSRLTIEPDRYRQAYFRLLRMVALLTMPLMSFMIATSDWLVGLVLGSQWMGVSRIFALLGIVGLIQPITNTTGWLFISQGRAGDMFKWGLIGATIIIISIIAGLPWGAVGVAASYSATFLLVNTPLLFWYVGRRGPIKTVDFYKTISPICFSAIIALGVALLFHSRFTGSKFIGLPLAFSLTVGVTLLVLSLLPSGRKVLVDSSKAVGLLMQKRGTETTAPELESRTT